MNKEFPEEIDKLLYSLAKELPESDDTSCPDEETLASYLDRVLPEDERENLLDHAAGCRKCLSIMAEDFATRNEAEKRPFHIPAKLVQDMEMQFSGDKKPSLLKLLYKAGQDILEQVSGDGQVFLLSPIPTRRESNAKTYSVNVGEHDIQISTDQQKDGFFEVWLKVGSEKFLNERCEWQFWTEDRLIEHQPAEHGDALFTDIPEGIHKCVLRIGGFTSGSIQLTLMAEA